LTAAEVSETETKYAVAAFRILLLTGCRLSEIQTLEWRHVDLLAKELRLPDSKTGAKTVHLGEAAVALLEALPRVTDNQYVIVGKKENTHLTDLQHPWRRIRKAAGLDDASTISAIHSRPVGYSSAKGSDDRQVAWTYAGPDNGEVRASCVRSSQTSSNEDLGPPGSSSAWCN
jgi:hypothetical protein